ncbi:flagellar basal body-associated FliL family protein [Thalassorhabdomicrobium marinisediminis]|uniref:flagellar basal body-associated FliL family protein n=1 Tax=Thalassorhabdomicrobium marinisediminis TaxID=2170577 RepID=UPI0024936190|nr:flagellar basal body-associated FliL family protein [Thalassorhabdomicrobium marinisediminis]
MKSLLIPLVLLVIGVGGGVGAGLVLTKEDAEPVALACGDGEAAEATPVATPAPAPVPLEAREYARMNNQFVVPVVADDMVDALVVMSLSIEVETGGKDAVFAHEPRLRDAFLQVMFDHANMGGFSGAFTATSNMRVLREALKDAADEVMLGHITDVLIVDIVRQDVTN